VPPAVGVMVYAKDIAADFWAIAGALLISCLLTLGARWQRVQVDDWSDGVKGDTGYDEEKVSPSGGVLLKVTD
ncbi:hypothetical protein, partial [Vibrio cholerae]|uniref:hypothetical protein n=1 Tax=Vibrio cholerae TaxID=666 RepID=UPI003F682403